MLLRELCSTGIIRGICVYDVSFVWVLVVKDGCLNNGFFQMYEGILMVRSSIELYLLSGEQSEWFCYFRESLNKFPVISYQSKESSNLLRCCWWVHVLNCMCFRG